MKFKTRNAKTRIHRILRALRGTRSAAHENGGFTLVEMLLVLFLFITLLVAVSDIFMRSQRSQHQSQGLLRLEDDVRYVMNTIADAVRSGSIDYECYAQESCGAAIDPAGGNAILALKNAQGRSKLYKISTETGDNACLDTDSTPCILVSDSLGASWQSMTQQGVSVDSAKSIFLIEPARDPFATDTNNQYLANIQPHVTIRFAATAHIRGARTTPRLELQTTVATREYKR